MLVERLRQLIQGSWPESVRTGCAAALDSFSGKQWERSLQQLDQLEASGNEEVRIWAQMLRTPAMAELRAQSVSATNLDACTIPLLENALDLILENLALFPESRTIKDAERRVRWHLHEKPRTEIFDHLRILADCKGAEKERDRKLTQIGCLLRKFREYLDSAEVDLIGRQIRDLGKGTEWDWTGPWDRPEIRELEEQAQKVVRKIGSECYPRRLFPQGERLAEIRAALRDQLYRPEPNAEKIQSILAEVQPVLVMWDQAVARSREWARETQADWTARLKAGAGDVEERKRNLARLFSLWLELNLDRTLPSAVPQYPPGCEGLAEAWEKECEEIAKSLQIGIPEAHPLRAEIEAWKRGEGTQELNALRRKVQDYRDRGRIEDIKRSLEEIRRKIQPLLFEWVPENLRSRQGSLRRLLAEIEGRTGSADQEQLDLWLQVLEPQVSGFLDDLDRWRQEQLGKWTDLRQEYEETGRRFEALERAPPGEWGQGGKILQQIPEDLDSFALFQNNETALRNLNLCRAELRKAEDQVRQRRLELSKETTDLKAALQKVKLIQEFEAEIGAIEDALNRHHLPPPSVLGRLKEDLGRIVEVAGPVIARLQHLLNQVRELLVILGEIVASPAASSYRSFRALVRLEQKLRALEENQELMPDDLVGPLNEALAHHREFLQEAQEYRSRCEEVRKHWHAKWAFSRTCQPPERQEKARRLTDWLSRCIESAVPPVVPPLPEDFAPLDREWTEACCQAARQMGQDIELVLNPLDRNWPEWDAFQQEISGLLQRIRDSQAGVGPDPLGPLQEEADRTKVRLFDRYERWQLGAALKLLKSAVEGEFIPPACDRSPDLRRLLEEAASDRSEAERIVEDPSGNCGPWIIRINNLKTRIEDQLAQDWKVGRMAELDALVRGGIEGPVELDIRDAIEKGDRNRAEVLLRAERKKQDEERVRLEQRSRSLSAEVASISNNPFAPAELRDWIGTFPGRALPMNLKQADALLDAALGRFAEIQSILEQLSRWDGFKKEASALLENPWLSDGEGPTPTGGDSDILAAASQSAARAGQCARRLQEHRDAPVLASIGNWWEYGSAVLRAGEFLSNHFSEHRVRCEAAQNAAQESQAAHQQAREEGSRLQQDTLFQVQEMLLLDDLAASDRLTLETIQERLQRAPRDEPREIRDFLAGMVEAQKTIEPIVPIYQPPVPVLNPENQVLAKVIPGRALKGGFWIENQGGRRIRPVLKSDRPWLVLLPGQEEPFEKRKEFRFLVQTSGLGPGFTDQGTITVRSGQWEGQLTVELEMIGEGVGQLWIEGMALAWGFVFGVFLPLVFSRTPLLLKPGPVFGALALSLAACSLGWGLRGILGRILLPVIGGILLHLLGSPAASQGWEMLHSGVLWSLLFHAAGSIFRARSLRSLFAGNRWWPRWMAPAWAVLALAFLGLSHFWPDPIRCGELIDLAQAAVQGKEKAEGDWEDIDANLQKWKDEAKGCERETELDGIIQKWDENRISWLFEGAKKLKCHRSAQAETSFKRILSIAKGKQEELQPEIDKTKEECLEAERNDLNLLFKEKKWCEIFNICRSLDSRTANDLVIKQVCDAVFKYHWEECNE